MPRFSIAASLAARTLYGEQLIGIRGAVDLTGAWYAGLQTVDSVGELLTLGDVAAANTLLFVKHTGTSNILIVTHDPGGGAQTISRMLPGQAAAFICAQAPPVFRLFAESAGSTIDAQTFLAEGAAFTAGLISRFVPEPPAIGNAEALFELGGQLSDGTAIAIRHSDLRAAPSAGGVQLNIAAVEPIVYWPDGQMVKGSTYGTAFIVNGAGVGKESTVHNSTAEAMAIANVSGHYGFALIPVNSNFPLSHLATTTAHLEGHYLTRAP